MKKVFLFLVVFSIPVIVAAQEMWGISNSNFSGHMGMSLNPATMVAAPYSYEINLLSGDLFLENNYIYIRKKSSLLSKSVRGEGVGQNRMSDNFTSLNKHGYAQVNLRGPSLLLNRGNFAFGLHTAFRLGFSARDVPTHFAKFMYDGFDFSPQHGIRFTSGKFKAALLQWNELGLSFGHVIKENKYSLLTGAITVKYLAASNAAYLSVNSLDYIVPSADLLVVNQITGSYGHTGFDNKASLTGQLFSNKGSGAAVDLGFIYFKNRQERAYACEKRNNNLKKYNYKIGFSLIDFGFVTLKKNASVFAFENASLSWPGIDTAKFENLADFDSSLSNRFFNDPARSLDGNHFNIFTPAAMSLQFDYCIKPKWFINASWIQRIPAGAIQISRPNQVSITPRYETRSLEVALPFSMYDYTQPRFGFAFRYKFLVLGTDKFGAFTGLWDLSGIDIYFGFKLTSCNTSSKRTRKSDCNAFN